MNQNSPEFCLEQLEIEAPNRVPNDLVRCREIPFLLRCSLTKRLLICHLVEMKQIEKVNSAYYGFSRFSC